MTLKSVLRIIAIALILISATILFVPETVSAANPVLSAYGITPLTFDIGKEPNAQILAWCTYTDADNDAPTTLNLNRFVNPVYTIIKAFTGNNSGDTTYSDGKLYYCTLAYYEFPFVGTTQVRATTASNGSATYNKILGTIAQIPVGIFFGNFGISPVNQTTPDNYTFFARYYSSWGYSPEYVKLRLDGTLYAMTANESGDTNYLDGKNYTIIKYLSAGFHTYSFNTSLLWYPADRYVGDFYLTIQNATSPTDYNKIAIGISIFGFLGIVFLAFAFDIRKR